MTEILTFDEIVEKAIFKSYPSRKVAHALVPVAKLAIEHANKGDVDTRLDLPKGIRTLNRTTLEYNNSAIVSDIIHFCGLFEFLDEEVINRMAREKQKGEPIDG